MGLFSKALARLGYVPKARAADVRKRAVQSVMNAWLGPSWTAAMLGSGGSIGLSGYYSTDPRRKAGDPVQEVGGSLNQLLNGDLYRLARQLRQLERNNASIRAIVEGHLADRIGTGIGIQPDTGDPEIDQRIRAEWDKESERIGVCGESDTELQRLWCREIDVAGNALGRIIPDDKRPKDYAPISIMPLEVEWLSPEPGKGLVRPGNSYCAGVEFDRYGRAVAYHLCDPNGSGTQIERVPVELIIHGFERKRSQQAVGEPGLCAVIERALQRGRLVDTELRTAINASTLSTFLKSAYHTDPNDEGDTDDSGNSLYLTEFPLGTHANLAPGDDIGVIKSDRPNMEVQNFARALDGDLAAAASVSRVWLDRDGAAYNFANSKFDQIRSNMLVKPWQHWFGRACAGKVYEAFLPFILLRLGIDPSPEMMRYKIQPDIPQETDENASADALKKQQEAGVITREDWLAQRGKDWRKVAAQAVAEQEALDAMAIDRLKKLDAAIAAAGLNVPLSAVLAISGSSGIANQAAVSVMATPASAPAEGGDDDDMEDEQESEEARAIRLAAVVGKAMRGPLKFVRDEHTGRIVGAE